MSSMRNAVQRRNHKERAQPLERQKWGLLEKHKDYSLRAKDHNRKKAEIKLLREKATSRNPDEFSFGMISSRSKGGIKVADRGNTALSHNAVKLLKTQDQNHIKTMLQSVRKDRARLEESLLLVDDEVRALKDGEDGGRVGKHMVFVDGKEEQKEFDAEEWFDVEDDTLDRVWNRPRRKSAVEVEEENVEAAAKRKKARKNHMTEEEKAREERNFQRKKQKYQDAMKKKLEAIKEKEQDLIAADQELELQRARTNGQIGGVNKNGQKFKVRQRRR